MSCTNYLTNGQTSENHDYTVTNKLTSVTCGSVDDCYVDCFGSSSCVNGAIQANSAKNLILTCRGPSACKTLAIVTGPTVTANISCIWAGTYVCQDASFTVQTTNHVNLVCDSQEAAGTYSGACYQATLTANLATNVNIECLSEYDCRDADFQVSSVSGEVVITGDGLSSLYSSTINSVSANSLKLNCNAGSACGYIGLTPNYKSLYSTSIYCIPLSSSCSNFGITIAKSTDIVTNFMELNCPRKSISGSCDIDYTCNDIATSASTSMDFDTSDSMYFCNDFDCCPWTSSSGMMQSSTIEPPLPNGITPTTSNATGEYYILESDVDDRIISCSNSNGMYDLTRNKYLP